MTARLCVIGSVNQDTFVSTPRIPAAGETILGSDLLRCTGGKGANQAVAAQRGGAVVHFVGAVGDDEAGRDARKVFFDAGIDAALLHTVLTPTACAIVAVAATGENSIIVDPGANYAVDPPIIDAARAAIMEADVLVLQMEIPSAALIHAVHLASEVGTPVILNAAPIPSKLRQMLTVIESSDCLIVNEVEAAAIVEQVKRGLTTLGPSLVVLTRGAAGLTYWFKGKEDTIPACKLPASTPVIDTVGAGDAFVGVFAMRWAELRIGNALDEQGVRDCLYWASAAGALACTRRGAIPAMPERHEVVKLLQEQV